MPYCTNCGEEVAADQRYCSYCGEPMGGGRRREHDQHEEQPTEPDSEWNDPPAVQGWSTEDQPGSPVPRKGAFETVVESAQWLFGVPVLIVAFLAIGVFNTSAEFLPPTLGLLVTIVGSLLGLVVGGVAYIYVDDQFRAGSITFGEAVSDVVGQLLSLVAIFLVYLVAVTIGTALFVLPGIYLGARLILAFPACVLGNRGAADSLSTSWELAGGNVLKLVGIFILSILPTVFITFLGAGAVGIEILESPVFILVTAPVSAIVNGVIEMATARVYLENLPQPDPRDDSRPETSSSPTQY